MPALPAEFQDRPIVGPANTPRARPIHPDPIQDGLLLEVESARELGYHGLVFGVDVPYLMVPTGWGEWLPLVD